MAIIKNKKTSFECTVTTEVLVDRMTNKEYEEMFEVIECTKEEKELIKKKEEALSVEKRLFTKQFKLSEPKKEPKRNAKIDGVQINELFSNNTASNAGA